MFDLQRPLIHFTVSFITVQRNTITWSEAVRRAFFALKERCAQMGLQVNDAKCHAYSRTRGAAQSVGAATCLLYTSDAADE